MSNDITHLHSILVIGEVTQDPYFGTTDSGRQFSRVEIKCVKTTTYGGNVKTTTEKYIIVTWSRILIDSIITKMAAGTTVAATGTHQVKINPKNGKISSEILVPSPQWGGSIHIITNTDEQMCYTNNALNISQGYGNISEGADEIPF